MIKIGKVKAKAKDIPELTKACIRAFQADLLYMPPGSESQGPPGYDNEEWNLEQVEQTIYYKILFKKNRWGHYSVRYISMG